MRFPDPYALRRESPKETVVFAACQLMGERVRQEDYFLNFNDECFVVADGVGSIPHGDVAAKFACETALWAYKHIRQHRYYWLDKKLFMKRIYRSTNMAVWQKRREVGFYDGLATTLLVLMIGGKNMWLGNFGSTSAWMFHKGDIKKMTRGISAFESASAHVLGVKRLGLVPDFASCAFDKGDSILLMTAGVGDYVTHQDMQTCFSNVGERANDLKQAAISILRAAQVNGSTENMTVLLVKRVA